MFLQNITFFDNFDFFKEFELFFLKNSTFLFTTKSFIVDSIFKSLDYLEKFLNSERIIYLEKLNFKLINDNIILVKNVKELEACLSKSSDEFLNNFWFFLFIISFIVLLYYSLIFTVKFFFKELIDNNKFLKFILPNKYKNLNIQLIELKRLVDEYNLKIRNTEHNLDNLENTIVKSLKFLKSNEANLENFKLKTEDILLNYKNTLKELKFHLDKQSKYVYDEDDIKNLSKFYTYFLNSYSNLIFIGLTFSNGMFGNFVEFLRILRDYEKAVELIKSKYTAISFLELSANWKFFDEKQFEEILNVVNSNKNNNEILNEMIILRNKFKLENQTSLNTINFNRTYLKNLYVNKVHLPEITQINEYYGKLVYHLQKFLFNYEGYIKNYKNIINLNNKLEEDISFISDKNKVKEKVKNIKEINLNLFKKFNFLKPVVTLEDKKIYNNLVKTVYKNNTTKMNNIWNLNENQEYSKELNKILETDLYKDSFIKEFEGSYEIL